MYNKNGRSNMSDLWNDLRIFFSFLSWRGIKAAIRCPVTAAGLLILWAAGLLRDIAKLGSKNCDG